MICGLPDFDRCGDFRGVATSAPGVQVLFSNRSTCYTLTNECQKALDDAKECVKIKPDWARGYSRKGMAESVQGTGRVYKLSSDNSEYRSDIHSVFLEAHRKPLLL